MIIKGVRLSGVRRQPDVHFSEAIYIFCALLFFELRCFLILSAITNYLIQQSKKINMSLFSKLFLGGRSRGDYGKEDSIVDSSTTLPMSSNEGTQKLLSEKEHTPLEKVEVNIDGALLKTALTSATEDISAVKNNERIEWADYRYPSLELFDTPDQEYICLKELLGSKEFQYSDFYLPCAIGKSNINEICCFDLAKMPNVLIAGTMGTGKSTLCHAMILSLLKRKSPFEMKLVLIDLKGLEFNHYNRLTSQFLAKIPDIEQAVLSDESQALRTLKAIVVELENRVNLLRQSGCRNIVEYNLENQALPYLVIAIDDFALLASSKGKELNSSLLRILEAGKAVGIHAIVGTSRLSSDIITSQMKSYFPARIVFRVNSASESRALLDVTGANFLGECGEMMVLIPGADVTKAKGAFVSSREIDAVTSFIGSQSGYKEPYVFRDYEAEETDNTKELDPLFSQAAFLVVEMQYCSPSVIQRQLKLGYNRAGQLVDQLEEAGVVEAFGGSKNRAVKVRTIADLKQILAKIEESR